VNFSHEFSVNFQWVTDPPRKLLNPFVGHFSDYSRLSRKKLKLLPISKLGQQGQQEGILGVNISSSYLLILLATMLFYTILLRQ
jgi:hypothetical protein